LRNNILIFFVIIPIIAIGFTIHLNKDKDLYAEKLLVEKKYDESVENKIKEKAHVKVVNLRVKEHKAIVIIDKMNKNNLQTLKRTVANSYPELSESEVVVLSKEGEILK
jgi:translation initiation factor 6 (eIF-6)